MKQVKWFDRSFNFESSQNLFPSILERLAGTPIRLEEKFKTIAKEVLTVRVNGSWTIKENVGHLIDLEPLWQGRLEDIMHGKAELREADLQNTQTSLANHDARPMDELLSSFRQIREKTLHRLDALGEEEVFMAALHPRLKTPMRTLCMVKQN
ncbi:DinB family protein [Cesiribacter sp. SM1]|uniref:DinB family protein n=1 Tax=Cesiribacter sp. SM1 TaxID=2861196 RepID=UPI001CD43DF0|nr:DinB family protein [Cesiribacter sp. SM1]